MSKSPWSLAGGGVAGKGEGAPGCYRRTGGRQEIRQYQSRTWEAGTGLVSPRCPSWACSALLSAHPAAVDHQKLPARLAVQPHAGTSAAEMP